MGACSMQRRDQKKLKTVEKVLEGFKNFKDIDQVTRELCGSTQDVFEFILNNQRIRQRITPKEYEFYSQKTEDLNTLKLQLEHFYNNYYRVVLTNTKFDELCFYNNITLKFILEIYLAMNTIKENQVVWWNQSYYFSREKLIQNSFGIFPQQVEGQGQITPLLSFMKTMIKVSLKLLQNEGIEIKEKCIEYPSPTKGSILYEQLKQGISI